MKSNLKKWRIFKAILYGVLVTGLCLFNAADEMDVLVRCCCLLTIGMGAWLFLEMEDER